MNYQLLQKSHLFGDIDKNELSKLLECLEYREKDFEKDEIIFRAGEKLSKIGVVLKGSVNIESYDFLGAKSIFAHLSEGDIFGEAYALAGNEVLTVNAAAAESCTV
ncbi:MAG: cyclic nucleotide-binding domain-containing protein, partial [Ruminiclostridium sp.]